jgi:hypothetical protein
VAALALATSPAFADEAKPTSTDAAASFAAAEQAFAHGEHARAGELFEQAHDAVAHPDAAFNAAQSWMAAGEPARAATWLSIFLGEAPPDARDRAAAEAKLAELSPTLGFVVVRANGFDGVRVDGRPVRTGSIYVLPGSHVVEGRTGDGRVVEKKQSVRAGESVTVVLTTTPEPPRPPPPVQEEKSGWSPLVVVGGGALAVGLGVTTIAFGVATQNAHDDFERTRSSSDYDKGVARQDLTNGFFWGTLAVSALTAAVAIFLVDWKR